MEDVEYLRERLEDQIRWYSDEAGRNKKWFMILKFFEILFALLLPVFTVISFIFTGEEILYKVAVIIIGVLLSGISTIQEFFGFHKKWIQYRTTAEALKHEKYLYVTRCYPYNGKDAFCKLVERVESIISRENIQWIRITREADVDTQSLRDNINRIVGRDRGGNET
jgi:hypothetical protein